MTDITEVYYCPLAVDAPAPPACPSCGGTGRVVRMTPTYAWATPCDAGACPVRARPGPVAATMTEGV